MINIGAVLGLLPIAGVPLPMFSYGGSALLPTMYAVGMLLCFARNEPAARAALTARRERSRKQGGRLGGWLGLLGGRRGRPSGPRDGGGMRPAGGSR
jgi:cell division protein FtsW